MPKHRAQRRGDRPGRGVPLSAARSAPAVTAGAAGARADSAADAAAAASEFALAAEPADGGADTSAGPTPARPRGGRSLRGQLVTPWFAAGAGIVIAAMLALAAPRHAVLSYGPIDPGVPCLSTGCAKIAPAPGSLASAKPGLQLKLPEIRRGPAGPGGAAPSGAAPSGAAPSRRTPSSGASARPGAVPGTAGPGDVTLHYAVLRYGHGTFLAVITVQSSKKLGNWSLEFVLPGDRITDVWGARWRPSAVADGGVASAQPSPWARSGPGVAKIMIFAAGRPRPPVGCTFDGQVCVFS